MLVNPDSTHYLDTDGAELRRLPRAERGGVLTPAELAELRLLAEQIGNAVAAGLVDPDEDEARIATLVSRLLP